MRSRVILTSSAGFILLAKSVFDTISLKKVRGIIALALILKNSQNSMLEGTNRGQDHFRVHFISVY